MHHNIISNIRPLGFTWQTNDPFLFCVHHLDQYPKGNSNLGPDASLAGRNLGQDFDPNEEWRMYHGETVPGFPAHPHRGFETVTVVLKGLIDHSDSNGGAGRYGDGDVQWMTAGSGLQHAEMFPLLDSNNPNPLELFQIWINLPKASKMVDPHYVMLWSEEIPVHKTTDKHGKTTEITVIAGTIEQTHAPAPAPDSWANQPEHEVAIWIVKMEANAQWALPTASADVNRSIYFYQGSNIKLAGIQLMPNHAADLLADQPATIENGHSESYLLLLQGRPIKEPVVQHGPFVMNSAAEIQQAFYDYRQTEFGGWPWNRHDYTHPKEEGRFARYADDQEKIRPKTNQS